MQIYTKYESIANYSLLYTIRSNKMRSKFIETYRIVFYLRDITVSRYAMCVGLKIPQESRYFVAWGIAACCALCIIL